MRKQCPEAHKWASGHRSIGNPTRIFQWTFACWGAAPSPCPAPERGWLRVTSERFLVGLRPTWLRGLRAALNVCRGRWCVPLHGKNKGDRSTCFLLLTFSGSLLLVSQRTSANFSSSALMVKPFLTIYAYPLRLPAYVVLPVMGSIIMISRPAFSA